MECWRVAPMNARRIVDQSIKGSLGPRHLVLSIEEQVAIGSIEEEKAGVRRERGDERNLI